MDATTAHQATAAATANRMVVRDAAGRAKFAQGAAAGDAVVYPVPVTALKKAQGNFAGSSNGQVFDVNQYAFGSPILSVSGRKWQHIQDTTSADWVYSLGVYSSQSAQTITWDYLTASGHPRVWAEVDAQGNVLAMWEAEDPADPEFPDEPPFEISQGVALVLVEPCTADLLDAVARRLELASIPPAFQRSVYAKDPLVQAARAMLARQLTERGLEEPPDIREALSIQDHDHRHWLLQLWLRQASRLLQDHRANTLIPLYREMCRIDRKSGRLMLK